MSLDVGGLVSSLIGGGGGGGTTYNGTNAGGGKGGGGAGGAGAGGVAGTANTGGGGGAQKSNLAIMNDGSGIQFGHAYLSDGSAHALESIIPGTMDGFLLVSTNTGKSAMFILYGGANNIHLVTDTDNYSAYDISSNPGKICLVSDGDSTFSFISRLGFDIQVYLTFIGYVI